MPKKTEPSLIEKQKQQIAEWLREADKLIRAGRYLVADEILQQVLGIDPANENARSYQERIQFLIKQLSQRPGLSKNLQEEIRSYSELLLRRKTNQSGSLLDTARKFLEDGDMKKASEDIAKALALDPGNSYAKALMQRLGELQKKHTGSPQDPENVFSYRSFIWETWNGGRPTEAQAAILKSLQKQLGIPEEAAEQIEHEVRNRLYRDALTEIWRSGGISAFTIATVDELREKFGVSKADHLLVESALLREMRKDRVRGTILVVDEDENGLLDITQKLRAQSFAVIAAAGVQEALSTLKTVSPDIILSEVNFQGKPAGFDLFEFIRSTPATLHAPFLFMAPAFDRTTRIIGKRLGVDEFIFKPIDYEILLGTLIGKLMGKGSQRPLAPHAPTGGKRRFT